MGGNGIQLTGSSALTSAGTFYSLNECYDLCWNTHSCQYFIWTHGTFSGSQCLDPEVEGVFTYGYQWKTFTGLCSMYGTYQNVDSRRVEGVLNCKDRYYQHFYLPQTLE